MGEVWKDIEGYEGLYQVSNLGKVKSLNYNKTSKIKILSPRKNNKRRSKRKKRKCKIWNIKIEPT